MHVPLLLIHCVVVAPYVFFAFQEEEVEVSIYMSLVKHDDQGLRIDSVALNSRVDLIG